jgi:hypothetical protein
MEEYFAEGMEASHCGIDPAECPYPVGSPEQLEWLKGFAAAIEDRAKFTAENKERGFGPYEAPASS